MIKEREGTTEARVDHGMVKGVAKEKDKVAVKVAHVSAGTVVSWVMWLQNAVSLVEFNRYKMVINQVLLRPLPEPCPQLLAPLLPLPNPRFAESTSTI